MILEKIQTLCNEQKISIKQLEKNAGLGNGTIGKWKDSDPAASNLKSVADCLGVSVDYFLKD